MLRTSFSLKHKTKLRNFVAWIDVCAGGGIAAFAFVSGFIAAHVALWAVILTILKAGQDVHFDVAEAYGWGQKLLLGYGKHPPLSGWLAGIWFTVFPAADWATYALAMSILGCSLIVCFKIALRVVDQRRAVLSVVVLSLYPIFNFKGFKYNADLVQILTLPLVVLAYLAAFEKRTARSGMWLGLACAIALLTKYWALTIIGAVGLTALIHPLRSKFLRSPAPWVAVVVLFLGTLPHLWWLYEANFAPLLYAQASYAATSETRVFELALGYINHNLALLIVPLVLLLSALECRQWPPKLSHEMPQEHDLHAKQQRLNVWMIQVFVAIGPPAAALAFSIYMKTDWGIPLFFLAPLAVIAIPALRPKRSALVSVLAVWLATTLAALATSPFIAASNITGVSAHSFKSELAHQLTEAWHARFGSRWAVVVGTTEIAAPMTFYSSDHPSALTPGDSWSSGLITLDVAMSHGFIGICDPTDYRLAACEAWMVANAPAAERIILSTRRVFWKIAGVSVDWKIYIVPPKTKLPNKTGA